MIRHGESIWNKSSLFTGWTNIHLTKKGQYESSLIANKLLSHNIKPTLIYTSSLYRAINTSEIINKSFHIPIYTHWRLNEKHYGSLEGIPRNFIRQKFGNEFTEKMRNDFYMFPPIINKISKEKSKYDLYINNYILDKIHTGESKKCVYNRLIPYWNIQIFPSILNNHLPLIVTHKHTGRALMKYILNINDKDFEKYKFPDKKILCVSLDKYGKCIHTNIIDY